MERHVGQRLIINWREGRACQAVRKHLRYDMMGDTLPLPRWKQHVWDPPQGHTFTKAGGVGGREEEVGIRARVRGCPLPQVTETGWGSSQPPCCAVWRMQAPQERQIISTTLNRLATGITGALYRHFRASFLNLRAVSDQQRAVWRASLRFVSLFLATLYLLPNPGLHWQSLAAEIRRL